MSNTTGRKKQHAGIILQTALPQVKMHTHVPLQASSHLHQNSKQKWKELKSGLSGALSQWSEIEKSSSFKSQDQEQLEKVRDLIADLKSKLKEF